VAEGRGVCIFANSKNATGNAVIMLFIWFLYKTVEIFFYKKNFKPPAFASLRLPPIAFATGGFPTPLFFAKQTPETQETLQRDTIETTETKERQTQETLSPQETPRDKPRPPSLDKIKKSRNLKGDNLRNFSMDLYSIDRKKVAEILRVSIRTVDRYVEKNLFSVRKVNGKTYFNRKEIEDFLVKRNTDVIDTSYLYQSQRLKNIQEIFSHQETKETQETETEETKETHDRDRRDRQETTETGETDRRDTRDNRDTECLFPDENNFYKPLYSNKKDDVATLSPRETEETSLSFLSSPLYKNEAQLLVYKNLYETTKRMYETQQEMLQNAYYKIGALESQMKNTVPLLEIQKKEESLVHKTQKLEQETLLLEQENTELKNMISYHQSLKNISLALTVLSFFILSLFFALA
jgi:hypothetical protein